MELYSISIVKVKVPVRDIGVIAMCQDHECACYDGEAYEKIEQLENDNRQMVKAFSHIHVNNGLGDFCRQCGLYLTHPVHLKSNADRY